MNEIIRIENISLLNQMLNQGDTMHTLISVVDFSKVDVSTLTQSSSVRFTTGFYSILLKTLKAGSLKYGRGYYDFQEGSLFFMSPNQVFSLNDPIEEGCLYGWGVYIHPDLIHGTSLYSKLAGYSFFDYDANEALHLSEQEKITLSEIVNGIDSELKRPIDKHSRAVLVSAIELLLNHCLRFYDRQFVTRNVSNNITIAKFETFLKAYFSSDLPQKKGLPTVKQCAEEVNLSVNYLTDLLKKETGKSTQEHIHFYILEEAKNKLLNAGKSVSEIAYELGFEYPQYFSKLFKKHIGISPLEYRNMN